MKKEISQINGKFYEKYPVIMCPTEKYSEIWKESRRGSTYLFEPKQTSLDLIRGGYIAQYLYVLSNKEIEDMNVVDSTHCIFFSWQYGGSYDYENPCLAGKDIGRIRTTGKYYEIIATNDESLKLPRLSSEFLKKFCELNGIWEVLVEYEEIVDIEHGVVGELVNHIHKLRVALDNTITIKPVQEEKLYNRNEVENLLFKYAEEHALTSTKGEIDEFNKWIKENL